MTKYVVQKAPIQGGQNYESIAERLVDNIFRADDSFREDVNTALVGRLNITQTFIDRLTFFYGSKSREQFEFILGEIGVGNAAQIKQQVDNISKRLVSSGKKTPFSFKTLLGLDLKSSLKVLSIHILARTRPSISGKYFFTSSLFFKNKSLSTNCKA